MTPERAAEIGQEALIWLAAEPEALAGFLAASGIGPGDLRDRAHETEFLGFVLDYVLGSDAGVLAFASAAGIGPLEPGRARDVLGGSLPNWT